jgi:hypothetical protein
MTILFIGITLLVGGVLFSILTPYVKIGTILTGFGVPISAGMLINILTSEISEHWTLTILLPCLVGIASFLAWLCGYKLIEK